VYKQIVVGRHNKFQFTVIDAVRYTKYSRSHDITDHRSCSLPLYYQFSYGNEKLMLWVVKLSPQKWAPRLLDHAFPLGNS